MVMITEEIWKALSENTRGKLKKSICVSTPTSNDSFLKRFLSNKTAFDNMREAYIRTTKESWPSMDECTKAFVALGEAYRESKINIKEGNWYENKINTRCSSHGIKFCFTCKCKAIGRFERRILYRQ